MVLVRTPTTFATAPTVDGRVIASIMDPTARLQEFTCYREDAFDLIHLLVNGWTLHSLKRMAERGYPQPNGVVSRYDHNRGSQGMRQYDFKCRGAGGG